MGVSAFKPHCLLLQRGTVKRDRGVRQQAGLYDRQALSQAFDPPVNAIKTKQAHRSCFPQGALNFQRNKIT